MDLLVRILNASATALAIIIILTVGILVFGGGLPYTESGKEVNVKFNIPTLGWGYTDRDRGYMQITYNPGEKRLDSGGVLRYDFTSSTKHPVGIKTSAYEMSGKSEFSFWMRAQSPCTVNIVTKDVEQELPLIKSFQVGNEWEKFHFTLRELFKESGREGKKAVIPYLEINIPPGYTQQRNVLWIDSIAME